MSALTETASGNLPATGGPAVADIDRIAGIADPIIRNLQITQAYHELSAALVKRAGSSANWCAFAIWASKQAGQTIRREDLVRTLQTTLEHEPEVEQAVMKVVTFAQRIGAKHAGEKIKRLTSRTLCFNLNEREILVQNPKRHLFTLALVGCLWLALILGCTRLKENSNSGQTSPGASPTNTATTSSPPGSLTNDSPNTASSPTTTAGVTMANYNRLQTGMTYAQVVQILGKEGEKLTELGSKEISGDKIVMYQWDGDRGGPDAKINAFFKNGKLDTKFQFDLK
jgi:hypothetical protein